MHTLPCAQNGTLFLFLKHYFWTGCMLMVVDFPAPLWPSSARIWPSNIAMSRLSTATCKLQLCPQQSVCGVSKANSILSILCWKWHFLSLALYLTPSSCCTSWYFCHLLFIPSYVMVIWKCNTCAALPSFLRVSEILVQGQSFARRIQKLQTSAAGPSRVEVKDRGNRGNRRNMESTNSSEQKRKKQILSYRKGGNWGNSSRDFCLWNFFCSCTFRWWSL